MVFITITLKENMLSCYLQTQTVCFMKLNKIPLKQMIFMKIVMNIRICLILVSIHKIQTFLMLLITNLLVKRKMILRVT